MTSLLWTVVACCALRSTVAFVLRPDALSSSARRRRVVEGRRERSSLGGSYSPFDIVPADSVKRVGDRLMIRTNAKATPFQIEYPLMTSPELLEQGQPPVEMFGLRTSRAMGVGEEIVAVSREFKSSIESSDFEVFPLDKSFCAQQFFESCTPEARLAIQLLNERSKGGFSDFADWFSTLPPPSAYDQLVLWTEKELSLLEDAALRSKVYDQRRQWKQIYTDYVKAQEAAGQTPKFSERDFTTSMIIAGSRSFEIEKPLISFPGLWVLLSTYLTWWLLDNLDFLIEIPQWFLNALAVPPVSALAWNLYVFGNRFLRKEKFRSILPYADFLNHNGNTTATVRFEPLRKMYYVETTEPVGAGQQIFLNYGDHSSSELLRRWGFVESNNPNERVSLTDALLPSTKAGEGDAETAAQKLVSASAAGDLSAADLLKRAAIVRADPAMANKVVMTPTGPSVEALTAARFLAAGGGKKEWASLPLSRCSDELSEENEALAMRLLLRAVELLPFKESPEELWKVINSPRADPQPDATPPPPLAVDSDGVPAAPSKEWLQQRNAFQRAFRRRQLALLFRLENHRCVQRGANVLREKLGEPVMSLPPSTGLEIPSAGLEEGEDESEEEAKNRAASSVSERVSEETEAEEEEEMQEEGVQQEEREREGSRETVGTS
uniref:Uncharacterized protein n=1 Tax=Chromera velia CCMP2878 TaxID=1169474 RepID=A0A0G4F9T3_9ALVE|eukprot:Cvel_15819.t1-p1 / transcript=Cvel_15819.t1 / gene=Cvel_15819 / organism=Chromera_velia_CCMP2878 / gene_product=hypothetical protein / transcript_product=hypothetical protein / location=Cvel_scaffold1188:31359-36274(-) / protein_length=664 / sequence_SO=supercontig / SO=protein_coding / is_pseudo=false